MENSPAQTAKLLVLFVRQVPMHLVQALYGVVPALKGLSRPVLDKRTAISALLVSTPPFQATCTAVRLASRAISRPAGLTRVQPALLVSITSPCSGRLHVSFVRLENTPLIIWLFARPATQGSTRAGMVSKFASSVSKVSFRKIRRRLCAKHVLLENTVRALGGGRTALFVALVATRWTGLITVHCV
jgi:hypothetical protein